jgi:hypothetical protein
MSTKFSDMARQSFAFLEDAGFRLVSSDTSELRFETAQVSITVGWDRLSGELEVFIGLRPKKGEREDAFSLTDLLRMEGKEALERKMPFQVADESRLDPFLQKLSADMRVYAQPALAGDRRSEAEKAWRSRKLDKLIDLYTSIEGHLTRSEKEKLDYARKHLNP